MLLLKLLRTWRVRIRNQLGLFLQPVLLVQKLFLLLLEFFQCLKLSLHFELMLLQLLYLGLTRLRWACNSTGRTNVGYPDY